MLTPQEVSTHVFAKARMGGYNMAMVDEFLDVLTEDYTTLHKENAALKAKLKVLVDKIEEYRATEDSMRATLLTAQKMADQMVKEAAQEKKDLLEKVEAAAIARKEELEQEIADEEERLSRAKEESIAFLANMRRLCNTELEFLDGVPAIQTGSKKSGEQAEASLAEQVAQSIESKYEAAAEAVNTAEAAPAAEEAAPEAPAEEAAPAAEEPAPAEAEAPRQAAGPEPAPLEPEDLDATRRIDFGDLKFGRNYSKND